MIVYYVHADHLNTPRLITDTSNDIRWRWDSDPFGTSIPNENPSSLGMFQYNLRFPGQQYDAVVGLHYNYFRDFDPAVGRYVESDPIGLGDGANTYAYTRNDPLGGVDPFGESVFKIIKLCANRYKVIREVGFKRAVQAARRGENVLAPSVKQQRKVAKAASDAKSPTSDPIHPDPKTGSTEGRMPHYHPNPRTGSYIFRDVAKGLTFAGHVECDDCIAADLAAIGDFFNPFSAPQDLIDTADIFTEEE